MEESIKGFSLSFLIVVIYVKLYYHLCRSSDFKCFQCPPPPTGEKRAQLFTGLSCHLQQTVIL